MAVLVIFIMAVCYGAFTIHLINHLDVSWEAKLGLVIAGLLSIYLVSMIAAVDILGDNLLPSLGDYYFWEDWQDIIVDSKHQTLAFALSLGVVLFFELITKIITYRRPAADTFVSTSSRPSVAVRISLVVGTIAGLLTIYYGLIIPAIKGSFP